MAVAESAMGVAVKKAVATLMELGGSIIKDDAIKRGPEFQIPEYMTLPEAAKYLLDHEAEERTETDVIRQFRYRPMDGAVATDRAIRKVFGTVKHKGTQGFFGDNPPVYVDVETSYGVKEQVAWGRLEIAAIPGCVLELHGTVDPELGEIFVIVGKVRRKYRAAVEGLFQVIEEELESGSIYKGQAIDAGFNYMDTTQVDPDRVFYAGNVLQELQTHVLGPMRYREQLKAAKVELKSAVLLHGTYGVGKTLFAYLSAQEAVRNGLTFIQVRPGQDDLGNALKVARQYSPAVVFVEDVDTVASGDNGRDAVSEMLEQFDGLRAKGVEVMAILTTNHPERIHKGMVRPGRIDAVIEVLPPDAAGIINLCKVLIPEGLLAEATDEDWANVGLAGRDYIPAFIHEACKRSIKYAIWKADGGEFQITTEDLEEALSGLRSQWSMMQDASEDVSLRSLDSIFTEKVTESVRDNIEPQFLVSIEE